MDTHFRTPKGTELPLADLRGKPYLQVQHRLIWFREEKPDWGISTSFHTLQPTFAIATAVIKNEKGDVMATAHKQEDKAHFADYIEKAETGAIGRALALIGYGTSFAVELEEEDRIVDAPATRKTAAGKSPSDSGDQGRTPSPKPTGNSSKQPPASSAGPKAKGPSPSTSAGPAAPPADRSGPPREASQARVNAAWVGFQKRNPMASIGLILKDRWGVDASRNLNDAQLAEFASYLEGTETSPPANSGASSQSDGGQAPAPEPKASQASREALADAVKKKRWAAKDVTAYMTRAFKVAHSKDLTEKQIKWLIHVVSSVTYDQAMAEFGGENV